MTAIDFGEVAFFADINKAVFSIYRVSSQFAVVAIFVNLMQSGNFIRFLFKHIKFELILRFERQTEITKHVCGGTGFFLKTHSNILLSIVPFHVNKLSLIKMIDGTGIRVVRPWKYC